MRQHTSKKVSERVLGRVLGKGSQKGPYKGACFGFYSNKTDLRSGSRCLERPSQSTTC